MSETPESPANPAETATPPPAPTPSPPPVKAETATDSPKPSDGTDWQALARKHEDRAKANKAAAEKAADEKVTAEQARAEAEQAKQQAETKQQEFLAGLAKLLGYEQSETPPDPAALQQTIAARDAQVTDLTSKVEEIESRHAEQLRERDVELAAWRAAAKHGANAPALLDSRTFLRSLAAMDPAGETFAVDLDEAVKAALVANPTLSATPTLADAAAAGIGTRGADALATASPGRGRLAAFHRSGAPK